MFPPFVNLACCFLSTAFAALCFAAHSPGTGVLNLGMAGFNYWVYGLKRKASQKAKGTKS